MKYKAVLFDLDGTLMFTIVDLANAVNAALVHEGYDALPLDLVQSYVGNGARNLITRALSNYPGANFDNVFAYFFQWYQEHCIENTYLYDGIGDLVNELNEKGVICCCITNKQDPAAQKLCDYFLKNKLQFVMGSSDKYPRKPDPTIINNCLREFNLGPEDACYIGDSEVDIKTANNAGMDGICVSWGFRTEESLKENGARIICKDIKELRKKLGI